MDNQAFNDSFKLIQQRFVVNLKDYLNLFERLAADLGQSGGIVDNVENYRNQMHKLAGSAKTFGFPVLNGFAADVELLLDQIIGGANAEDVATALNAAVDEFLIEARKITGAYVPPKAVQENIEVERTSEVVKEFDYSIVVVDDDELVRDLVRNGLAHEKCKITPAADGGKVLQLLEKTKKYSLLTKPDLIVLDVNMPGMGGLEVLGKIKSDPEFQSIPVIMLTRRDEDETVMKAFSSGALDYITKPFAVPELAKRILSVLKREKKTVLIADGDDLTCDLLRQRFFLMGYTVLVARNGNEALARLHAERPSIAILEVDMPGIDGLTILTQTKQSRASRDIPIVMLTGNSNKEYILKSLDGGAHDCVTKPFDIDELAARVSGILRREKNN